MLGQLQLHYPLVLYCLLLYSCVFVSKFLKYAVRAQLITLNSNIPPLSSYSCSICMGFS